MEGFGEIVDSFIEFRSEFIKMILNIEKMLGLKGFRSEIMEIL